MSSKLDGDGWEQSECPIVCETCLGDNPYVRMTKEKFGKECKVCARPFTIFRWRPGTNARYKKTEVCQTCAKMKNVCQVCLLDLEYGLPVQVRDAALQQTEDQPKHEVNREYFAHENEKKLEMGLGTTAYEKAAPASDALMRLARTQPYYARNRAHVCSFFLKGNCTRGQYCPYLHELPNTDPELAKQNFKDRYYGTNDPVAKKMLARIEDMPKLVPPTDRAITTLYLGKIDERVTDQAIFDTFYAYGEIKDIRVVQKSKCAFVTYTTRESAEVAAERLHSQLLINGCRCVLRWGRPQSEVAAAQQQMQQQQAQQIGVGATVAPGSSFYPSMDPQAMGARLDQPPRFVGAPPPVAFTATSLPPPPPPPPLK